MKYRSDFRLVIGVPDLDVVNCFTLYHCLIRALRSCHCKSAFRPIYIYMAYAPISVCQSLSRYRGHKAWFSSAIRKL